MPWHRLTSFWRRHITANICFSHNHQSYISLKNVIFHQIYYVRQLLYRTFLSPIALGSHELAWMNFMHFELA